MIGKRVDPDENGILNLGAGDYGMDAAGNWMIHPPKTEIRWIDPRKVVEHKDGTITICNLITKGVWIK